MGLGLAAERAAAIVAMGGILGMVAPPINIPAMLIGTGIDLPYVGFGAPLAVVAFPLALAIVYGLGWPLVGADGRQAIAPAAWRRRRHRGGASLPALARAARTGRGRAR